LQIIAEKTGFSDAYYFNKVFKAAFGIPPHKYRMLARQSSTDSTRPDAGLR
jgi:transcriptional regulator GlxA family with amidase domain